MKQLMMGMLLIFVGQFLIWFQTNGQFLWRVFERNPFWVSLGMGTVISYSLILATKNLVGYFDGLLWPPRFIAFGMGVLSFTVLTYIFMGEGITLKTGVSLLLSVFIILIQLLWK